jgi:hypothetical protein
MLRTFTYHVPPLAVVNVTPARDALPRLLSEATITLLDEINWRAGVKNPDCTVARIVVSARTESVK